MLEHEKAEDARYAAMQEAAKDFAKHEDLAGLATKKDLEGLATQKSVEDVLRVFNSVKLAIRITETTGKFSYRTLLVIAAIVVSLGVIVGGWKAFIVWLSSFITH